MRSTYQESRRSSIVVKLIIILFTSFCPYVFLAQDLEPIFAPPLSGADIAIGEEILFTDMFCQDPLTCQNESSECLYKTIVELYIDPLNIEDNSMYSSGLYEVDVNYNLEYYNENGVLTLSTNSETVSISFDIEGGSFKNRALNFYDYKYSLRVIIESVQVKLDGVEVPDLELPTSCFLQVGANINRYNNLTIMPSGSQVHILEANDAGYDANYVDFNIPADVQEWSSFDLEWTWIDDSQVDNNGQPLTNIQYDFKNNSTRINTYFSTYRIPNIYREGIILARYRALGRIDEGNANDCETIKTTAWSLPEKGNLSGVASKNIETHQAGLNWQHSRSYAEEGKHKDVINYFDGSLRSRQTVSKLEAEQHSIVAESIYDHVGRPVINILPSPVIINGSYASIIDFFPDVNMSATAPSIPYNWQHFELISGTECKKSAEPLSTGSGPSRYYSSQNEVGQSSEQDYVPSADGFPFSQTIFTQDGTGRVSYQGGVGPDHQANSNHDTEYFYDTPSQKQLDRLFGINVGYSEYYKKNMVVDPNGQVSISMLDNKNRVVATALAGPVPSGLLPLDVDEDNPGIANVFTDTKFLSQFNFSPNEGPGKTIQLSVQPAIPNRTNFTLEYTLTKLDFTYPLCLPDDICFDCEYEVRIKMTDECNSLVTGSNDFLKINHEEDIDLESCVTDESNQVFTKGYIANNIDVGSYTLTKELRLDSKKLKEYEELYVLLDECITSKVVLLENLMSNVSLTQGCVSEECFQQCLTANPAADFDFVEDYKEALLICLSECEPISMTEPVSQCNKLKAQMLADVSPFGAYGSIVRSEDGIVVVPDGDDNIILPMGVAAPCISMFYPTTVDMPSISMGTTIYKIVPEFAVMQVDILGEQIFVKDLPVDVLLQVWEKSWAEYLLPYHPEYTSYLWCTDPQITDIINFEQQLMSIETFEEANDLGYLNPLGFTDPSLTFLFNLLDINTIANGVDPIDDIAGTNPLDAFLNINNAQVGEEEFSLWEIAYLASLANVIDIQALLNGDGGPDDFETFIVSFSCNKDNFWTTFRSLYIQLVRRAYLDEDLQGELSPATKAFLLTLGQENVDCPDIAGTSIRLAFGGDYELDENFPDDYETADDDDFPQLAIQCGINCNSYRKAWLESIAGCWPDEDLTFGNIGSTDYEANLIERAAFDEVSILTFLDPNDDIDLGILNALNPDIDALLDDMVQICITGCDRDHVQGSSEIAPGEAPIAGPNGENLTNFDEAITAYIGSSYLECNASLITAPKSYGADIYAGTFPSVDDCVCDRYSHIYDEFKAATANILNHNVEEFHLYLKANYSFEKELSAINDLHCICLAPSLLAPDDLSFVLDQPYSMEPIPAPFACVECLSCPQFHTVITEEFMNTALWTSMISTIEGPLNENKEFREIFTNWMNEHLNFNLTFYEYFDFLGYCGAPFDIVGTGNSNGITSTGQTAAHSSAQYLTADGISNVANPYKFGKLTKGQKSSRSSSMLADVYTMTVEYNKEIAKVGVPLTVEVSIENTSTSGTTGDNFSLLLPAGWDYDTYPTGTAELYGGTVSIDPLNASLLHINGISVPAGEQFTWTFETSVPEQIFLSRYYTSMATLVDPQDESAMPLVAEDDIWIDIPDPCLTGVEESEDMEFFLEYLITNYSDDPTACDPGIPLSTVPGFATSSINFWNYVDISNLRVTVCSSDLEGDGVEDDYTFLFYNECQNEIECDLTIYDFDFDHIVSIQEVKAAQDLLFSSTNELTINYRDDRYDHVVSTRATSTCYSFTPCDKRSLCNRPINFITQPNGDVCAETLLDLFHNQVQYKHDKLVENSRQTFNREYVSQCLNTEYLEEELVSSYENKEYHYTLYYYDQSGSLVQTIPPKGVVPLEDVQLEAVTNYRNGTSSMEVHPAHYMPTKYKYNSFGQIDAHRSPDLDVATRYWYDYLGRPVLSRDGRQLQIGASSPPIPKYVYSYALYDELGRIKEVGELYYENGEGQTFDSFIDSYENNASNSYTEISTEAVVSYVENATRRINVIRSIYDIDLVYPDPDGGADISIDDHFGTDRLYLRKRISSSLFLEDDSEPYDYATHYDYDIHGNVKTLLQEYRELAALGEDIKRIDYDYDLISGNIHMVRYQEGDVDQFFHRYKYDADNRLEMVETSKNKFHWDADASYTYYDHGPLARVELGEFGVQGCDYLYTIHGWIKGVNSVSLDDALDPGKDGRDIAGMSIHRDIGNDAYGYSLDYYDGDYTPIRAAAADILGTNPPVNTGSLYNGNISRMTTALRKLDNSILPVTPNEYKYDQLHRIKEMTKYGAMVQGDGIFSWATGGTTTSYATNYTYDANGNLKELTRNDESGASYDELTYMYDTDIAGNFLNRLRQVEDDNTTNTEDNNLQTQEEDDNYKYDDAGNMTSDVSEEIEKIVWDQYGKIRDINRSAASTKADLNYHYDAMGNRIVKVKTPPGSTSAIEKTYYVRDASGNVMAVYKSAEVAGSTELYEREHHIYGSSRLGIKHSDQPMQSLLTSAIDPPYEVQAVHFTGNRTYELSNHLSNVLSTVSDNKLLTYQGTGLPTYKPEILSHSDYYPFGWQMPGMSESKVGHRYGFNGKEKDDEVKGDGVQYDYGFRIYDSRVARFLSVDPLTSTFPWWTPYQFAGNNPIRYIDLDGLEFFLPATLGPLAIPKPILLPNPILLPKPIIMPGPPAIPIIPAPNLVDPGIGVNEPLTIPGEKAAFDKLWNDFNREFNNSNLGSPRDGGLTNYEIKPYPIIQPQGEAQKNDTDQKENYQYFYRAMSYKEFIATGGTLQGNTKANGEPKGDGPFVSTDKAYLLSEKSFINKRTNIKKYDIIVTYKVEMGTKEYLDLISIQHPENEITEKSRRELRPIKKTEKTSENYGFPGQNGNIHFNPRIIDITTEPIIRNGE